jgi:enterochelin esterase-like enzyme
MKQNEISWINPFKSDLPGLSHAIYYSNELKQEVGFGIYLPPGYFDVDKRFPVIYWLHGKGGNEAEGFYTGIPDYLNQAILSKKVQSMVMVLVNGVNYSMFSDSYDKTVLAETTFIKELIPFIDNNYRTVANISGRALEGFSMGGNGALKLAFKYPRLFSSVITYGGSFHDLESMSENRPDVFEKMFGKDSDYYQENSVYELADINSSIIKKNLSVRMVVGTSDFTFQNNQKVWNLLEKLKIKYKKIILDGFKHIAQDYYKAEGLNGFKYHFKNINP